MLSNSQIEIEWLFGDLFDRRLAFENGNREVFWSSIIRLIQTNSATADKWAGYIRSYRNALLNPDDAPRKLADELKIDVKDFDAVLFDVFSEISAVPKLRMLGFDSFELLLRSPNEKTPDLKARRNGKRTAVEIKNLRAHETIETLFPKLLRDHQLKGREHASGIRLEVKRSFRETLSGQERDALVNILLRLKEYPRNEDVMENLSERAVARFVIADGSGAMCSDGISARDLIGEIGDFRGLFAKIQSDLEHAAQQLYAPAVADAKIRVAAMRWDIPWFKLIVPVELRSAAKKILGRALAKIDKPIDLLVFTDHSYELFNTLQKGPLPPSSAVYIQSATPWRSTDD
jgi:hypothetical protein